MTNDKFDGLMCNVNTMYMLSDAKSRSISSENRTGAKSAGAREPIPVDENGNLSGPARELGLGWKLKPNDLIKAGETLELANIEGPGCIQQIWMTPTGDYRHTILRIYYDDQEQPSVECPVGDFFASAFTDYHTFAQIDSAMVCVNPGNAFNCYWPMPFRKRIRITMENISPVGIDAGVFYQINYALNDVPDDAAYFHAQFRRTNPLPYGDVYTMIDGIKGKGQYVGTYMAWGLNNNKWWGEGEVKFYMDGDTKPKLSDGKEVAGSTGFPTICGTGTEDYFCGSYNFENKAKKEYQEYSTQYAGVPHIVRPDGVYNANTRFSMYRWHVTDPIRFEEDLKVTVQALGWRKGGRYLPLQDDIASVAFWYQTLPTAPFPELPSANYLEII
ncbi:MAG: glycoside hydrolase family 172 protein [Verrucomicrobiota bacterium]|nr:glycoside hydrolase family 172 protein [Verrucomicrobiota bacterium]